MNEKKSTDVGKFTIGARNNRKQFSITNQFYHLQLKYPLGFNSNWVKSVMLIFLSSKVKQCCRLVFLKFPSRLLSDIFRSHLKEKVLVFPFLTLTLTLVNTLHHLLLICNPVRYSLILQILFLYLRSNFWTTWSQAADHH